MPRPLYYARRGALAVVTNYETEIPTTTAVMLLLLLLYVHTTTHVRVLRENTGWCHAMPNAQRTRGLNPFRAPEPLLILNPSNVVPKKGFPVVKGLMRDGGRSKIEFSSQSGRAGF